jgi:hypothetical protein
VAFEAPEYLPGFGVGLGLPSSNRDDKVAGPEIADRVPLLIANLDRDVDFLRGRGHLTDGWRKEKRSRDGS